MNNEQKTSENPKGHAPLAGVMCRFLWKTHGQEFPNLIISEDDYEQFDTLMPTPSGDYILARISSLGEYELVDTIGAGDVVVLNGT